jgi:hypothetical protein
MISSFSNIYWKSYPIVISSDFAIYFKIAMLFVPLFLLGAWIGNKLFILIGKIFSLD